MAIELNGNLSTNTEITLTGSLSTSQAISLSGDISASTVVAQVNWGNIKGTLSNQEDLQDALDDKVDKVDGKGLSTNDYTTEEKTNLALLNARGRFLSPWNCTTGLPVSFPGTLPYTYKVGDYYRINTVATGNNNCTHNITIAGTCSNEGIHEGTYSVSFTLTNQVSTSYSTIGAISEAIGPDNFVEATGVMHTTDAGDLEIIKVIQWADSAENSVIALLDDSYQKVGLTLTTADTLTDIVSGGGTNYKPNGSQYTGTASTTVATDTSIAIGDIWYYDGSDWSLEINHANLNYSSLSNKPQINSVTLQGNKAITDFLTEEQTAALNSGITSTKVASYEEKVKVVRNASECLVFYKETIA